MGTSALTKVVDDGVPILAMYVQSDGYLDGHGEALAKFLRDRTEVDGIGDYSAPEFNTISCLAAQIVAKFKAHIGGIYLVSPNTTLWDYEYAYVVESAGVGKPANLTAYKGKKKVIEACAPDLFLERVTNITGETA